MITAIGAVEQLGTDQSFASFLEIVADDDVSEGEQELDLTLLDDVVEQRVELPPLEELNDEALPIPPEGFVAETFDSVQVAVVPPTPLQEKISALAASLLKKRHPNPEVGYQELVWYLLANDQRDLAYQFVRHHPQLAVNVDNLPDWLLHALALSLHVRHDIGEIAAQLNHDFTTISQVSSTPDTVWNDTTILLTAAAAIQPALLAPSTGAALVLMAPPYRR